MGKQKNDRLTRMDSGRKYLEEGDYSAAEETFKQLLQEEEDPVVRNNFALARYAQNDWLQTTEILELNLRAEVMNPYARALAAKAYVQLEKSDLAEKMLNQAVIQFNWGASRFGSDWFEYLLIIAETAGILQKHRLVMELHQKWSHRYTGPFNFIYAGIAYYNLGRYGQAVANWTKVMRQYAFLEYYVQVTRLIEVGTIPAFPLEYTQTSIPDKLDMQWLEDNINKGQVKMFLLGCLFEEKPEMRQAIDGILGMFIRHGGEWGEKLAREILSSNTWGMPHKMATGRVLQELGVFAPDELIPMRINGKDENVQITKMEVATQNDRYDQIVREALQLLRNKDYSRAEKLVNRIFEEGVFYPPAMEMAVRINYLQGKFAEAASQLEALLQLNPENQHFLIMMMEIQYRLGDLEKSRQYMGQVEPNKLPAELQNDFTSLCEVINGSAISDYVTAYKEYLWKEVLDKPLPVKPLLQSCLKRIPAEWLTAICLNYKVEPEKRRNNREGQIVTVLKNEAALTAVVSNLPQTVKALLQLLVNQYGRVKLGSITRRFGSIENENYFWTEEPPQTPLGQLIAYGLVFVGTMPGENGRRYKMAVIPDDLLEQVKGLV